MFVCKECGYKSESAESSYLIYKYKGKRIVSQKRVCRRCYEELKQ